MSHPVVKELVDKYKYKVEAAIEAVDRRGDMDGALDYLSRKGKTSIKYQPSGPKPCKESEERL